jgi:hypothetical protein
MDVTSYKGAKIESDPCLVGVKLHARISSVKISIFIK